MGSGLVFQGAPFPSKKISESGYPLALAGGKLVTPGTPCFDREGPVLNLKERSAEQKVAAALPRDLFGKS